MLLGNGICFGDRCILQDFQKLPPAHAMTFDLREGAAKVWRYWQLPELKADPETDETALLDDLEVLLEDALGRQLVADVPTGILLSGGVDSSLVTAMAIRHSSKFALSVSVFPVMVNLMRHPTQDSLLNILGLSILSL